MLGIQSTECGSDNAFFPKGSTLTFPPATITLPCGTGSIAFTAYNGAASGKPTGKCANAPVTITPDPLPVKLVAFECEVSNEGILLKWQTTEEINSNKFVVQRSQNAIEFKDIVELNSVGTTNEISEYDFLDYTAPFGINYYRLMQIDLDGSIDYSKIISIKKETIENETFTIFPNPVTTAHFTLQGTDKKIVSARLLSINGEKFELEPAKWNDSKQEIELPSSIKNGLYILHIQTAEKTIIRKIIIE